MAPDPAPAQPTPPNAAPDRSAPQTPHGPASGPTYSPNTPYTPYAPYPPYPPYPSYPDAGYAPYPYPAPAPGGYYPWMFAPLAPTMSTWALVSMICGLVSVVTFQPIVAALAIVFGFIGLSEIKKSPGQFEGRGMGIAGVVLGFVGVGIFLLFILFYILYFVFLFSMLNTMPG
ncbi:MAG: DUF4190 domain-containing protein [Nitrososphaerota archaeon]